MTSGSTFLQFWWTDRARDTFLSCMPKEDLLAFRLACHDFSVRAAPLLFRDVSINFRASTFTRPARIAALDRVGHHIHTFTFSMPHGPETFLPPLLDSTTGEEVTFVYEPYTQITRSSASRLSNPTYGSWEMTDLLVKQYPPLFHSAANVPSFIRAFSSLHNLKHLKVSCPGQDSGHRYRRNIVDYALISLRVAIERNRLLALDTLSLLEIHPGAIHYLNPVMGIGALPNSLKRWAQIRNLAIHMDSIPSGPHISTDHLKHLHSYLHAFSPSLRRLIFRWNGRRGPFPLSLGTESPLLESSPALACPRRCHIALQPLRFQKLRHMEVENTVLDASQVSSFITSHRRTIREFNFEDSDLRTGTWEEALSPLTRISGSELWKDKTEEVMDVPLLFSPVGLDKGQMEKVMRDNCRSRNNSPRPSHGGWQKASAKGRELFWGTPEHMKRFLRSSVFSWR